MEISYLKIILLLSKVVILAAHSHAVFTDESVKKATTKKSIHYFNKRMAYGDF